MNQAFPRTGMSAALAIIVVTAPVVAAGFAYREALPGYRYQFPRDHFEHRDFQTEWWYYTGNVTDTKGDRFGFELVFFRLGERHPADNKSAWTIEDLYLGHAALTDVSRKRFRYEERLNRQGPGIAGASFDKRRIWNGNWSTQWRIERPGAERQTLDAMAEDFRFHLELNPETPFVVHGENGVSQKGNGAGRASHYVSFPLERVSGEIEAGGISHRVTGRAWMDHEWFTEQLAPDQQGWDWFSIQLDNHTELMLFDLRRKDGSLDPHSSGTFIAADGTARHLTHDDFSLEPLVRWHKYPIEWRLRVPSLNIDLICRAVIPDQELRARLAGTSYWEGAVDYKGTHTGVGYLEMTGYE
jgi:predicted secreted hydrolase